MLRTWIAFVAAACLSHSATAHAGEPPGAGATDASSEARAVQAFGDANTACAEWTDGCVVCSRGGGCSLPGIACQPKATACTRPDAPAPAK